MMREEHGLRMLQMRISGQDDIGVLLRRGNQNLAKMEIRLHKLLGQSLAAKARVGRHLVVARAARMETLARLADASRELGLDGHVNVLVVDIERKVAGVDIGADLIKSRTDRLGIILADDPLCREHPGMSLGTRDVLTIQVLVDRQRCAELLRDLRHASLKTASPQRHGKPPQIDFKQL